MQQKLSQKREAAIQERGRFKAEVEARGEDMRATFNAMEMYLQMGIRMMDMRMILEGLELFKRLGRHPKNSTLKFLGNLKGLPIEIQTSLMDF